MVFIGRSIDSAAGYTAFTDAITEDWGGKPFVDMKKGWDYILSKYSEVRMTQSSSLTGRCLWDPSIYLQIDPDRAVAAGASWGGYAIKYAIVALVRMNR